MTFKRCIVQIMAASILLISACVPLAPLEPIPTLVPTIAITYVINAPREEARVQPTGTPAPTQTLPNSFELLEVTPRAEATESPQADAPAESAAAPQDVTGSDYAPPSSSDYAPPDDGSMETNRQPELSVAEEPTQTPAGVIIVGDVDDPRANQTPAPMPTPEGEATSETGETEPTAPPADDEDEGGAAGSSAWATFYLFSTGDDGAGGIPAGCGDSLVEVNLPLETPTDEPLRASLERLFAIEDQYVGDLELYNPLWQSDLAVQVAAVGAGGNAEIALTGELVVADPCDNIRIREMLDQTARSISGVEVVNIMINDSPIEELFPTDTSE